MTTKYAVGLRSVSPEQTADVSALHGSVRTPNNLLEVNWTLKIPLGELSSGELHGKVPGFGGFKQSSRLIRDAMAQEERVATFSYNPPRFGGTYNDVVNPQKAHYDALSAVIESIAGHPELPNTKNGNQINVERLHLLAHSMGTLAATAYGLKHPESVKQITIIEGVGAQPTVGLGFIPRVPRFVKNELLPALRKNELNQPEDNVRMAAQAIVYYCINPLRTAGEIGSCMLADVASRLVQLQKNGVFTALLYGGKDTLVDARESLAAVQHLVNHATVIEDFDHLAPQRASQVKTVAHEITKINRVYAAGRAQHARAA